MTRPDTAQHQLESLRRKALLVIVALVVFAVIRLVSLQVNADPRAPLFSLVVIGLVAVGIVVTWQVYQRKMKRLIMPQVLVSMADRLGRKSQFFPDLNYSHHTLARSHLVTMGDALTCTNLIRTSLPTEEKMAVCNVATHRVHRGWQAWKPRECLDKGVFVERMCHFRTGIQFVIRDRQMATPRELTWLGIRMQYVPNVNPDFDRYYQLFASDPERTLRFLSPPVIAGFLHVVQRYGHISELSFFDDEVYVFINNAEIRVGRAPLWRTIRIPEVVSQAQEQLTEVLDIIDSIYHERRMQRLGEDVVE